MREESSKGRNSTKCKIRLRRSRRIFLLTKRTPLSPSSSKPVAKTARSSLKTSTCSLSSRGTRRRYLRLTRRLRAPRTMMLSVRSSSSQLLRASIATLSIRQVVVLVLPLLRRPELSKQLTLLAASAIPASREASDHTFLFLQASLYTKSLSFYPTFQIVIPGF